MAAAATVRTEGSAQADLLRDISDIGRTLDDVERARIRMGNRITAITRRSTKKVSLNPALGASFETVQNAEGALVSELELLWRKHPLAAWSKQVPNIGDKLVARLVAEIGDPLLRPIGHFEEERNEKRRFVVDYYEPRSFAQLSAYCGHGDPERSRRRRGVLQEEALQGGNPVAKKRLWLIALQGTKTRCPACRTNVVAVKAQRTAAGMSATERDRYVGPAPMGCTCERTHPLRYVYDFARAKYADKTSEDGKPWSDGHAKAAALRYASKHILRMLYVAAQDPELAAREAKASRIATTKPETPFGAKEAASSRKRAEAA